MRHPLREGCHFRYACTINYKGMLSAKVVTDFNLSEIVKYHANLTMPPCHTCYYVDLTNTTQCFGLATADVRRFAMSPCSAGAMHFPPEVVVWRRQTFTL